MKRTGLLTIALAFAGVFAALGENQPAAARTGPGVQAPQVSAGPTSGKWTANTPMGSWGRRMAAC